MSVDVAVGPGAGILVIKLFHIQERSFSDKFPDGRRPGHPTLALYDQKIVKGVGYKNIRKGVMLVNQPALHCSFFQARNKIMNITGKPTSPPMLIP